MKTFNVEILGYEYSCYDGGPAGDYSGTKTTPNSVIDFLSLPEKYDDLIVEISMDRSGKEWVTITDSRPFLYWDHSYHRCIREPRTGNLGIHTGMDIRYKMALEIMGTSCVGENLSQYCKACTKVEYTHYTVKEFKTIIKRLYA